MATLLGFSRTGVLDELCNLSYYKSRSHSVACGHLCIFPQPHYVHTMFAVIETGGKQYLIETNQMLKIEKLEGETGSSIVFDKVLLLAKEDGTDVKIGTPYLEGVSIEASVELQGRSRKIRVVKFKNKVRYKRVRGHRQHFTKVKVKAVEA